MRMRVDQARQYGAVTQIDQTRSPGDRAARSDPLDAISAHQDVDVVLHAAAAVEDGRRAQYDRNVGGVLGQQYSRQYHERSQHQLAWVVVLVNCDAGRRPSRYMSTAARSVCIVSVLRSTRSFGPCEPLPSAPRPSRPSISGATNEISPAPRRPGSSAATPP